MTDDDALRRLCLPWEREDVPALQQIPVEDPAFAFFVTFWSASSLEKRTAEIASGKVRWHRIPDAWFPSSGYNILQGVQQFANALFHTRNNPDLQRALWIEAHLHEMMKNLPEHWRGAGAKLIYEAEKPIRVLLRDHSIQPGYHHKAAVLPAFSTFDLFRVPEDLYDLGHVILRNTSAVMGGQRLVYGGRIDENVVWFPEPPADGHG